MTRRPRVLFVQYANPASYPPIDHSTRLLAERGCDVKVLGVASPDSVLTIPAHGALTIDLMPHEPGGWRQKIHYTRFMSWAAWTALQWKPDWVYLSDPLSAPAGVVIGKISGARVIYHEHDAPTFGTKAPTSFMARVLRARHQLAMRATLCIVPNDERREDFARSTGRADALAVWNTPLGREVLPPKTAQTGGLRLIYQGSIVPARVPVAVIDALRCVPAVAGLVLIGYSTAGHRGHIDDLKRRASEQGVSDRVEFAGEVARPALFHRIAAGDVGLALFPTETTDVNERTMVGASNKPFEYLACGLPILVGNQPLWHHTFVAPGYARPCEPALADSIARELRWFVEHPRETTAMGEAGRQRVIRDWNYERTFAPVLDRLIPA